MFIPTPHPLNEGGDNCAGWEDYVKGVNFFMACACLLLSSVCKDFNWGQFPMGCKSGDSFFSSVLCFIDIARKKSM